MQEFRVQLDLNLLLNKANANRVREAIEEREDDLVAAIVEVLDQGDTATTGDGGLASRGELYGRSVSRSRH